MKPPDAPVVHDNRPQCAGTAEVRAWAMTKPGAHLVNPRGALPRFVIAAWNKAHPGRPYDNRAFAHGTVSGFGKGCRCDECRAAHVEHVSVYYHDRVERGLPVDDSRHGTSAGYKSWGCRCESCREWQHRHHEATKGGAA